MRLFFRKFSVTQKLWFLSSTITLVLVSFFYGYYIHFSHLQFKDGLSKKANGLVQTASSNLGAGLYFDQIDFVHRILQGIENDPDIAFLYVSDNSGERFYGFRDEQHATVIRQFLGENVLQKFGENFLLIKQSIFFHDDFEGYLIAGFNLDWVQRKIAEQRQRVLTVIGILIFFLFSFTFFIARNISKPIQEAVTKINRYGQDESVLDFRLPEEGDDEITHFARAFNKLAGTLESNLKELEQSKKYVEALFRLSPIPILITDPRGKIEVANESACRFFDVDMEQLLKYSIETFFQPKDFHAILNKAAQTESEINGYITTLVTANGTKKVVEVNLSTLRDNYYVLKSFIIAIIDVTEKMLIQREILENQSRLHEMNRELIQKTSELEKAIEKNRKNARKLEKLIEVSQEIIRSASTQSILEILIQNGKSMLDAQESVVFLWDPNKKQLLPVKASPGSHLPRMKAIADSDGVVWRTFSENRSYFLSSDSLGTADLEELGFPTDEKVFLISVPISEKDYKFGVVIYIQRKENVFTTEDLHLITTLTHQAAITLDKLYLLQALREKAAHLGNAYADLQKSQQQIVQLQKMESLGTLVGGIAHDFNNILGIITPNVELIMMKTQGNKDIMKRLLVIQEAASRAADLTRQLLMFSRNQDVRLEPISPNQLIMRLAAMFRRTLGKHIEVVTELDPIVPYIKADETRLTQVIINLAVNARDAMPEGGTLTLKSALKDYLPDNSVNAKPKKYVCISVSDTGSGISDEHLGKIFDPFFTTKTVGKGTGLGLSVVYGIVKSHNGFIEVQSKLNQGTTFEIYFEPFRQTVKPSEPQEIEIYPVGHENILVVDDEEMIRDSLKDILQSLGYNVVTAASGKEAIDIVNKKPNLHMAIVDFAMPHMNGLETIKIIRNINPRIKLLLSSGHAEREQLMNRGVKIDGFLPKPYHITDLARKIKEIIKKPILSAN